MSTFKELIYYNTTFIQIEWIKEFDSTNLFCVALD